MEQLEKHRVATKPAKPSQPNNQPTNTGMVFLKVAKVKSPSVQRPSEPLPQDLTGELPSTANESTYTPEPFLPLDDLDETGDKTCDWWDSDEE